MGVLVFIGLLVAAALWYRRLNWWAYQVGNLVRSTRAWQVGVLVWVLMVCWAFAVQLPAPLVVAAIMFALFWLHELRILLAASDEALPGRNDKLIWALYLLFCPPVGVVFFRAYREKHWAPAKAAETDWI